MIHVSGVRSVKQREKCNGYGKCNVRCKCYEISAKINDVLPPKLICEFTTVMTCVCLIVRTKSTV